MENKTIEQWADEIAENKIINFPRDDQPSNESQPLIEKILRGRGDNIEFFRDSHGNLGIIWKTAPDTE